MQSPPLEGFARMAVVIACVSFKLTDFYNNRHVGLFFSFFRLVNSLQEGGEGSGGGEGGEGNQQAEARSTLAKFHPQRQVWASPTC